MRQDLIKHLRAEDILWNSDALGMRNMWISVGPAPESEAGWISAPSQGTVAANDSSGTSTTAVKFERGTVRSSCPHGGGHPPTLAEVSANLRAGAEWAGKRDLPDVDGWADFIAAPELVRQRLISRVQEDRCPSVAHTFPLPKSGKGEVRKMAWLNPYDDLHLRIVVGRVALAVEAALGPDVFSYRLADDPPAWSVQDVRVAFRLRRERARELLAAAGCNAMAVADLRNYYPSVEPEVVMDALRQASSPQGAVTLIGDLLRNLEPMGAPGGLPIGPEASGLLGNIVLLGLDKAISCRVQGHIRYTDDSWMFLGAEPEWPEVLEVYAASVSNLGLEPVLRVAGVVAVPGRGAVLGSTPRRWTFIRRTAELPSTSSSTGRSPI